MGPTKTAVVVICLVAAACTTPPPRPTFETGSKPVEVPTVLATPCIDPREVPDPYVPSFVNKGDMGQNAAAASADLRWIVPRYDAARAKLIKCAQESK